MKIDIHTHTRKCKSGDADTREISSSTFCDTILSTDVGIVAITNHNVFDLVQYKEILAAIGGRVQVWPGVELDVRDGETIGHLLVVVSPVHAARFAAILGALTEGHTPDSYSCPIDTVLDQFDPIKPLYVAHYRQKRPNISDAALLKLETGGWHPSSVIKEVTNPISAGIYISHGHASIYGSDVQDWSLYQASAQQLPDLRLPVDSFEHFCLLLQKDRSTINTALDRKTSEDLDLIPFDDGSVLTLKVFNDINVVFGPKGTGKSCILEAIAKHYSESGFDAEVFASSSERLESTFDVAGKDLNVNLNTHGINYCTDEIEGLRTASEASVTSLSKFVSFFKDTHTNRNAKRLRLKDIEPEAEGEPMHAFVKFNTALDRTRGYLEFLQEDSSAKDALTDEEYGEVTRILSQLLDRLGERQWAAFLRWQEIRLLNSAIDSVRNEVERKTGNPARPSTTGFQNYALNRVRIAHRVTEVTKAMRSAIPLESQVVGSLGPHKGPLELRTEFRFQDGSFVDGSLKSATRVGKSLQSKFGSAIVEIHAHVYDDDLFQWVAQLNAIEDVEKIKSVFELLQFKRYFALDGQPYEPSSGESAMVMLHKELNMEKDIYILDEPEKSLGNEYISDVIVPLLKQRARAGKKVFVATHDANIAVRTLPYCSIYRSHGQAGYHTYIGNPFSNDLVNLMDEEDRLDWKKISMRTLEGGEEAFGERGNIYGSS